MNKKLASAAIIVLILVFIGYIVYDAALKKKKPAKEPSEVATPVINDQWSIEKVFEPGKGQLNSVAVSSGGDFILGGDSYIACYHPDFTQVWEYKTEEPVTALATSGGYIYAAVQEVIEVLDMHGLKVDEWGPYESNVMITSVAANDSFVAFADAQGKVVYVLDKKGVFKSLLGKTDVPFVIPSGFFDVALDDNNMIYVANTGKFRIERRNVEDKIIGFFGESGSEPNAFCGCCNPAHFALMPGGYVTAEKGINRIKILDENGNFIEFVSSANNFMASVPLDLASCDGTLIYAANPADSKLYVFKRRSSPPPPKGGLNQNHF